MSAETTPPVAKYRYTAVITGNSHEEIENELLVLTRGGYLLDSNSHTRDEFSSVGGRVSSRLEHTNPDVTPERYDRELMAWWEQRKAERRAAR